jgi:hypothetical protein
MDALRSEFQTIIHGLQTEILALRQQLDTRPTRPKPALPDPDKFSGTSYRYDTWLPSIRAKLRVDGAAIGDSVAQFYYVYLNLDSSVQSMVLPQLSQAERDNDWSYQRILDQLSRVYDNPNKVQEAEDKLLGLKQGSDALPAYVARFERLLYEARGQDWADVNKITVFRNGLSSALRGRLSHQLTLPADYPGFVRVVQQLAGRSFTSTTSSSFPSSHHPAPKASDPMDVSTLQLHNLEVEADKSSSARALALNGTRSPSPHQRRRWRVDGKCVRCGGTDHWVQDCPVPSRSFGKKLISQPYDSDSDSEAYDDYYDENKGYQQQGGFGIGLDAR